MDPVSAIGLIASLAQLIDATSKTVRYLNSVKNAPKSRAHVAEEATLLLSLLTRLRYRVEDADVGDPWVQGVLTLGMAQGPLDQFKEALESLAMRLHGSNTGKSVGKALVWTFEKKEIDELLGKMERLKSFINLALQGDILNLTKSVKSDTVGIPVLHTNVLTVKDDLDKLRAEELARDHTTNSIKTDTAGIPILHTDVAAVKNDIAGLRAEEQVRHRATKMVKADTALIPGLHSDMLIMKNGVERQREATLAIADNVKREKILSWISQDNARETYMRKLQERQPGTGNWFLKSKAFLEWLAGRGKSLWCPGIPGAGKTILACVAMNELEKKFEADATSAAACVFCDYKDTAATTPINLISNLLRQILERQKDLPKCVSELYEKQETMASKQSLEDMTKIFKELAKTQKIYLIVDALDECSDKDDNRNMLLRQLSDLRGACNVLMTSRSSVSISEHFDNYLTIEISAKSSDIDKYIAGHLSSRLQAHIKQKPSLYEEIRSVVNKRAQNMFLLVKLHMDSLSSKQTPNAVRKALQTLPTGVFETYDDVLQRIEDQNEDDRQLAKNTLMWLSLSLRPVTMKELQHAVTIDESFDDLDEDDIPSEEIIVSVCTGLVSLAAEEGVVQLVHFTAQEYFSQADVRDTLFFDGQRRMLSSCLSYLLLGGFDNGLPEVEKGLVLDAFITKYPLFYYAAHNWGHHARAARLGQQDQEMILKLIENEQRVVSLIDALHMTKEESIQTFSLGILVEVDRTGLWLASYFGLLETVNHLLENGVSVDARVTLEVSVPNTYSGYRERQDVNSDRTALTVAAWNGHASVVRLLLDNKANTQVLDINGALYNQHHEIVNLLLRHNAPFHTADKYGPRHYGSASEHITSFDQVPMGYYPIHWCARFDNVELMKLLLVNEALVDVKATTQQDTPLIVAAKNGHASIVRFLLDQDAEVNAQNAFKETAMHEACKNGFTAIVKLLLGKGASFNLADASSDQRYEIDSTSYWPLFRPYSIGWGLYSDLAEYEISCGHTAFEYALEHEHIDVVELLLKANSSAVLSNKPPVPLLLAAHKNNLRMVELLIQHGAEVNTKDGIGRTALFWAAVHGSAEMTKMLLAKASEVDARNEDGTTPLHMAAECQSPDVVKLLIEHGASVSSKRESSENDPWDFSRMDSIRDGSTPLHLAASMKILSNVQLLIEAGADIHAMDDRGRTPFYLAIERSEYHSDHSRSHKDAWLIAQLLLSRGAKVDTCDDTGMTPLMSAAKNWDWQLVQLLLSEGADGRITDKSGQSALHLIFEGCRYFSDEQLKRGPRAVLEVLRLHGMNFNARDDRGNTPLFSAVRPFLDDANETLDLLCEFGADISATNYAGNTLLHHAVACHHYKSNYRSVVWLLDAGVPVEARNCSGESALLNAAGTQRIDVVELLVGRGANITVHDDMGQTPLAKCLDAYGSDEDTLKMVKTLIKLGAGFRNSYGHDGGCAHKAIAESSEVFNLLVTEGMDVNAPDSDGNVPLLNVIHHDEPELTQRLLDAGARIDAADSEGTTALHQAARAGDVNNARLLVSKGAKVAQLDSSGKTALHLAFIKDDRDTINCLIKRWTDEGCFEMAKELLYMALAGGHFWGARMICNHYNPEECNMDDLEELYSTAIEGACKTFDAVLQQRASDTDQIWLAGLFRVAIRLDHREILHALIGHKLDVNERDLLGDYPLHIAATLGSEEIVSLLLDSDAEIELQDRRGNTPLMLAADTRNDEVLERLIERGAKTSHANSAGATALHLATTLDANQALISAGASVNAQNNQLQTPLHLQAENDLAIVQCLLDAGANVNLKDSHGDSPLHLACGGYHQETLTLMLKHHPDMTSTDGKGRTPLQIACSWEGSTIIRIISEHMASS